MVTAGRPGRGRAVNLFTFFLILHSPGIIFSNLGKLLKNRVILLAQPGKDAIN